MSGDLRAGRDELRAQLPCRCPVDSDALGYQHTWQWKKEDCPVHGPSSSLEWQVPHWYKLGERVTWEGVELVCTREHYAGHAATHPWDPGNGWDTGKAGAMWAPNGPVEAEKLEAVASTPTRLASASSRRGQ